MTCVDGSDGKIFLADWDLFVMSAADKQESAMEDRTEVLIANEIRSTVHSMFTALQQKIVVDNARTLEDLTREMLRPMLKSWLDNNLPTIVERLVRAEIDRVSPQPRTSALQSVAHTSNPR
jgi:cell pole-organizing protein PopZ